MARLIVIAHESEEAAKESLVACEQLAREGIVDLKAASVVRRREGGEIEISETSDVTDRAATWGGAFWGGLLGVLVGGPVVGAGVGAAVGRISARHTDLGISDAFQREVGSRLTPGKSAAVFLVEARDRERALGEAWRLGGELIESDLDPEAEIRLRRAIEGAGAPEPD